MHRRNQKRKTPLYHEQETIFRNCGMFCLLCVNLPLDFHVNSCQRVTCCLLLRHRVRLDLIRQKPLHVAIFSLRREPTIYRQKQANFSLSIRLRCKLWQISLSLLPAFILERDEARHNCAVSRFIHLVDVMVKTFRHFTHCADEILSVIDERW